MAFMRTGWGAGATVAAFRGTNLIGRKAASLFRGENVWEWNNSTVHTHADANTFVIWSRGEFAVTPAGYAQRETSFQNSLLVDGQGQYISFGADHIGRPDGQVTKFFTSRTASVVEGEAAKTYRPGLSKFLRRLYVVEPGIVFLVDDIAAERPVMLEWLFHVDNSSALELGQNGFTSVLYRKKTFVRASQPGGFRFSDVSDSYNRGVTMALPSRVTGSELMAVIVPSVPADAQTAISTPSGRSFIVEAIGSTVLAAFSSEGQRLEVPGRVSGEGSAVILYSGSGTAGFFVEGGMRLSLDGEPQLVSSAPVTVSYARTGSSGLLTVSASSPSVIRLVTGFETRRVRRSDGQATDFVTQGSRISLTVPVGSWIYEIMG
jgi:hypothetical protein